MKMFEAATPAGRKTAVIMLMLTSTYLVFELGFNARLLDVVGGSATHDEVEHIEKYGRIISGVALTLLVWGGQIKNGLANQMSFFSLFRRLVFFAVICISGMYIAQKMLVDYLANDSSSDLRSRAAMLVPISHLLTSNNFKLAQFDLSEEAFKTPEGKTFIATFALQAMAVPKLYEKIVAKADDIFRITVVGQRGTVEKSYEDFQKSVVKLKTTYADSYSPGVVSYQRVISDIPRQQRDAWNNYTNALVYRGAFGRVRKIEPNKVPVAKWPEVREKVRAQGVPVDNHWRPGDKASFIMTVERKVRHEASAEFSRQSKESLKSDVGLQPGLTVAQWMETPQIQKKWRGILRTPDTTRLAPEMSVNTYESQVYEPAVGADILKAKTERLAPVSMYADGAQYETVGKDSARALMVPPIALAFSLLGAFTHILKCALFIAKMFVAIPGWLFATIMSLYLSAVMIIPFGYPNEVTKQKLVSTLAKHTETAFGPIRGGTLNFASHWVMLMQKYFYPVNETVRLGILKDFSYGYHGGKAD